MTSSWRWFIHPETAISMNRNGSRTLCVFKVHYRDHRAAVGNHRRFTHIQFSDHTGLTDELLQLGERGPHLWDHRRVLPWRSFGQKLFEACLLYTSPSPRDGLLS